LVWNLCYAILFDCVRLATSGWQSWIKHWTSVCTRNDDQTHYSEVLQIMKAP